MYYTENLRWQISLHTLVFEDLFPMLYGLREKVFSYEIINLEVKDIEIFSRWSTDELG
jgi:hypothetical protein